MLSDNLKKTRENLGLTQQEVVDKAKEYSNKKSVFTQAQLSNWENGSCEPNRDNLALISIVYNKTPTELEEGTNENDIAIEKAYSHGFNIGVQFKNKSLKTMIYSLTEPGTLVDKKIMIISEFIMKNGFMIPSTIVDSNNMLNTNNEKATSLIISFTMGLWNGNCASKL